MQVYASSDARIAAMADAVDELRRIQAESAMVELVPLAHSIADGVDWARDDVRALRREVADMRAGLGRVEALLEIALVTGGRP